MEPKQFQPGVVLENVATLEGGAMKWLQGWSLKSAVLHILHTAPRTHSGPLNYCYSRKPVNMKIRAWNQRLLR